MTLSPQQVLTEVNARAQAIKTLKGDGTITIDSQEGSNSASFEVFLKKPDSVRVELQGPFGLHLGTLSLTKETFIFYDRRENVAITGIPNGKTLQSLFRLNLEYQEIMDIFTGEFFSYRQADSLLKFAIQDDQYVFHYRSGSDVTEYEIDGTYFYVSGFRVLDGEGNPQTYSMTQRPFEENVFSLPSFLRIVFAAERRSVTIVYDNIELNVPVRCSFSLPDNIQILSR
jgi:outer membrane lipoprotein-sorting protein